MNETTAIETRCAIKAFDPEHRMSEAEIKKLMSPAMFVAIGKGIKDPWPRGGQLAFEEIIIQNKFK